jgi:hypothetical protein
MMSRLATKIRNLARIISEDASSALWLFIGVGAVRLLIRLARKVPVHPVETADRIKDGHQQLAPVEPACIGRGTRPDAEPQARAGTD